LEATVSKCDFLAKVGASTGLRAAQVTPVCRPTAGARRKYVNFSPASPLLTFIVIYIFMAVRIAFAKSSKYIFFIFAVFLKAKHNM
jgi:hypothetical protein